MYDILNLPNLEFSSLLKVFLLFAASSCSRYLIVAGISYLIFWKFFPNRFSPIRIPNRTKVKIMPLFELRYSLQTMVIFGGVGTLIAILKYFGYNQLYTDFDSRGTGYFIFSIIAMIFIHDAYFYFCHKIMHHPKLYKRFHAVHHKSVNPTPLAAFSFHPLEAVVEALIILVVTLILPIHFWALFIFNVISLMMNVYGHLGYEISPKDEQGKPLFKWLNTSVAHNLHHQMVEGNYGLYFSFWDKRLKTWRE